MKNLTIYSRTVVQRTRFKKYRYKEVRQVVVCYDGNQYRNCRQLYDDIRLRKPFQVELQTRSKETLEAYIKRLGRSDVDKWLKGILSNIVDKEDNHEKQI